MPIHQFLYQSRFNVPKPPTAGPTVSTFGQQPSVARESFVIGGNVGLQVIPPEVVAAVPVSFGQQPAIAREGFVIGGNIGFQFIPPAAVQISFGGFAGFPDLIRTPAPGPLPETTRNSFIPPIGTPISFADYPDLVRVPGFGPLPETTRNSFVSAFRATFQGAYLQSPEQFKRPRFPFEEYTFTALQIAYTPTDFDCFSQSTERIKLPQRAETDFTQFAILRIAYTPTDFDSFSQSPWQLAKPRMPGLDHYSFVSSFRAAFQGAYLQAPEQFKLPIKTDGNFTDFAILQIAYTTGPLTFSQSPEQFKAPRILDAPGFVFVSTVAFTPTDWDCFSHSPEAFRRSRTFDAPGFVFVSTVAVTPTDFDSFSQSPEKFTKPRLPLELYSFVSSFRATFQGAYAQQPAAFKQPRFPSEQYTFTALQIAYTPSALTFTQSAEQFRQPRSFDAPGFVFVSTVAVTPTDFDSFSQSPEAFKRSRFPFEQYTFTALQIAYTPSALVFSQSPSSEQFKAPRQPALDRYSFSFLQIAYTPSAFGFSQSPEQFSRPRFPGLDTYSFVSAFRATFQGAYAQAPTLFKQPRHPAPDRYDFAFLQVAYTPGAFGFAQAPEQFRQPTPNQNLNSGAPGFQFVPTVAATPSEFQFSQHPHVLLNPRMPGLDQYSFTSPFIVAATPSVQGFSQAPWQFQLPIASSLLNTGVLGWPFGEPPPFVPSVLPSTGHYPFGERPTRRNRGLLRSRAHPLFRAEITANLGNRLTLYAEVLTLSQARIHFSGTLSVQINASFDPRSSGNIRGFVRYDDDEEILQAITFLMTKQLDDK